MMAQSSDSDGRRRNSRIHGGGRLGSEENRPRGRHASDAGLRKGPELHRDHCIRFYFQPFFS